MQIRRVEFAGAVGRPDQTPPDCLPHVAIAGRSNVGKSSLINVLVGRKRIARVSQQPGKTREINFYRVNDDFMLVDLPGYGYARASKESRQAWANLIASYLGGCEHLVGVVVLLDARRGVMKADRRLLGYLGELEIPALFVLTKIDKLNRAGRKRAEQEVRHSLEAPEDQVLATSARTREGLDGLTESIYALIAGDSNDEEAR
jgi:GTP-binding protein